MTRYILVLDNKGLSPNFQEGLMKGLECRIEVFRSVDQARYSLNNTDVSAAIVNPYAEQGGVAGGFVNFVKIDLKQKNVPVLIFSRIRQERIAQNGLILGENYQAYLRKPSTMDKIVEEVGKLIP
jgi:hypothetical protein